MIWTWWTFFALLSLAWAALVSLVAGVALAFTYLVGYIHEKNLPHPGEDDDALQ